MGSGKTVEMTPEGERASIRRAISAEVNQEGRVRVLDPSDEVGSCGRASGCLSTACRVSRCGIAEANDRAQRASSAVRTKWMAIIEADVGFLMRDYGAACACGKKGRSKELKAEEKEGSAENRKHGIIA